MDGAALVWGKTARMKVLVYANCQSTAIGMMLGRLLDAEIIKVPAVQNIPLGEKQAFMAKVAEAGIVVHQPIGAGFVASTDELRDTFPDKTFVSFPSVYFAGLFPQVCGLKHFEYGTINGPLVAYHDARIARSFLRGHTIAECISGLNEHDPSLLAHFDPMFAEAETREAELDVQCMDIVRDEFRNQQLFYTFNHPTNFLLFGIASRIARVLGKTPTSSVEDFPKPFLNGTIAAVPSTIAEHYDLAWRQPLYALGTNEIPDDKLVEDFYHTYSGFEDFAEVCRRNPTRVSLPLFARS